jgi:formate dehydrogenase maturation protein FdhE
MKCWHCKTDLIWGGDYDIEDSDDFSMVTNLSCPSCDSYVEVFLPKEKEFFKELNESELVN